MGSDELLRRVEQLGREFVRRGMEVHARKLRVYYLALRHRLASPHKGEVEVRWSEERVLEWLKVLRLPPFEGVYGVRPWGSGCLRCEKTGNDRTSIHTEQTFPGGAKMSCYACGDVWLEEEDATGGLPETREDALGEARRDRPGGVGQGGRSPRRQG